MSLRKKEDHPGPKKESITTKPFLSLMLKQLKKGFFVLFYPALNISKTDKNG